MTGVAAKAVLPAERPETEGDTRACAAGETVFAEGRSSDVAYVILSGKVEVIKSSPDGGLRLETLEPGAMFGEMGVLDGAVRSTTATAVGPTLLRVLDRERLLSFLIERPEAALDLAKTAERRLRRGLSLIGAPASALVRPKADSAFARLRRLFRPAAIDLGRVRIEFQPDAIEIEERPLPFGAKAILYAILGFIVCGVTWASLAQMDRIVVANGRITTADAKIVVQPMATATIRSIAVHPGEIVDKDQVLVALDPTFAAADEQSVRAQMKSASAEIRRLEAELALAAGGTGPGTRFSDDKDEQTAQMELFRRHSEARSALILASGTETRELETHMAFVRADRIRVAAQVATTQKLEAMREKLYTNGNGSLISLYDAQRQLSADQREEARLVNEAEETSKKIDTLKAKLAARLGETSAKAAEELQAVRREHAKATEQIKKQERLSTLVDLRSPARAMVLDLGNRSVGSVVKEGEQMVTLVALDVPLGIDATIEPKDISYVRVGDTVRIKLEPFPYQKYGTLEGVIQSINGDVTEHEEGGRKLSAYKVRIVITRNDLRGVPADVALLPGMASTCEIKVGTRRLITYFLYPIIRTLDSGLREP